LWPAWASEINSCTPRQPPLPESPQEGGPEGLVLALSPTSMPSTSRWPLAVMPTATITALEITQGCLKV